MNKDEEKRQQYNKQRNRDIVKFRVNSKEKQLLDNMMQKDGWNNFSGFVKYKLFGDDIEAEYEKFIETATSEQLVQACATELKYLNAYLAFIQFRYEKDMKQLYKEEGVDINKWIKATQQASLDTRKAVTEVITTFRRIANRVGVNIKGTDIVFDSEKERLDKIAQELFEEYPDRFL